ncbi:MAG: polysaccharide biosynthesis/export family protein [Candidatus Rokubacteria bacterium]|nr:polysaccharide biosynthesis/export family protein [Candidatus Rokubacteria bacterium]
MKMPLFRLPSLLALSLLLLRLGGGSALAAEEAFVIGPEDVLDIQVWDNKDLNQVTFVRPDGKISLPLVGEVQAAGKTVQSLTADLVAAYGKTVKEPAVTVIVRDIKSRPVYFIGGFGKAGPLQLTRELNMLQALGIVGGVVAGADAEKGFLLRGDKRLPLDFDKLLRRGDLSQNTRLEPGDTVVVPLADVVYIQGEVRAPGVVKYTNDLTIVKAITLTGGLTQLAAAGRVDLVRTEGEKKVRIRIDLDKMLRAPEENPDMRLRPDDIIFVPQRLF